MCFVLRVRDFECVANAHCVSLWCVNALRGCVAWVRCVGALRGCVAWMRCALLRTIGDI